MPGWKVRHMEKRKIKFYFRSLLIFLVCVLVIFSVAFTGTTLVLRGLYKPQYRAFAEKYAAENSLELALVYGVIHTESGFNPDAESEVGALGLMQITPQTFQWLQTKTGEDLPDETLKDPETNIRYGCLFLGLLQEEFGTTREILAAYHAGRGSVNGWLSDYEYSRDGATLDKIPYGDTAHYVKKVERAYKIYSNLYGI